MVQTYSLRSLLKVLFTTWLMIPGYMLMAQTNGDAVINHKSSFGVPLKYSIYDLKGTQKIPGATKAKDLFSVNDMNGVRIPIYGDAKRPAHPGPGNVDDSYYKDLVAYIKRAQNARGDKDFIIFASKKLDGQTSFPDWVKDANGIVPGKYAILVADYLEYMKSQGIVVDYLGIDNEFLYNEGNITPQRYKNCIDQLKVLLNQRGIKIPLFVGYEDYGPDKNNWVSDLLNNGWGDRMDVYGTHYYPRYRPKAKLLSDLNLIGNRPFWSTEAHWDSKSTEDDFVEAVEGMLALWDQTDEGLEALCWWALGNENSYRGTLMREATFPLKDARPIEIDDKDGKDISVYNKLHTRAFFKEDIITVYAINPSANQNYQNYGFRLSSAKIVSDVQYTQHIGAGDTDGKKGNAQLNAAGDKFTLSLPPQSITVFSFHIGNPYVLIPARIQAENFEFQEGVEVAATSDTHGKEHIRKLTTGDYSAYHINAGSGGEYQMLLRYASGVAGGKVTVYSDNAKVGEVQLTSTGGWSTWKTINTTVSLPAGNQTLKMVYTNSDPSNPYSFDINWIEFKEPVITGTALKTETKQLTIYPNPTSGIIKISKETDWTLFAIDGRYVLSGTGSVIDLENQNRGIYILEVEGEKMRVVKK